LKPFEAVFRDVVCNEEVWSHVQGLSHHSVAPKGSVKSPPSMSENLCNFGKSLICGGENDCVRCASRRFSARPKNGAGRLSRPA
jgi:hypothetical protein